MEKKDSESCSFLGVFFIGILLVGITANYYFNKEPSEERDARNLRIVTEFSFLHSNDSSSVATSAQRH